MNSKSIQNFDNITNLELNSINGGTFFGAAASLSGIGAGAGAICSGAAALQAVGEGAAIGSTLGPIGTIIGGGAGIACGAYMYYKNIK